MERHRRTRWIVAAAAAVLLASPLAACGDDDDDAEDAATGDTTEETTETTADTTEDDGVDAETVQVGMALCEAFGAVGQPGGVDAVLDMLTDDVVFGDVVLGADLTGKEQVRAYLTSEAFEGIDSSECGAMVRRGSWGAGAYTLSNSETGAGGSGIAAVHVTDGLVDRQVVHYTQFEADAPTPPEDTVSEGVVFDYCRGVERRGRRRRGPLVHDGRRDLRGLGAAHRPRGHRGVRGVLRLRPERLRDRGRRER